MSLDLWVMSRIHLEAPNALSGVLPAEVYISMMMLDAYHVHYRKGLHGRTHLGLLNDPLKLERTVSAKKEGLDS